MAIPIPEYAADRIIDLALELYGDDYTNEQLDWAVEIYYSTTPDGYLQMTIIPENQAELIRLKTQMEIIRTVCPIMMLGAQIFILIKLY